jgi:hypothetical protein
VTTEDARSLMQESGYSAPFIERCFTPLLEPWGISASPEGQSTLRLEHTDGSLSSEFVVDLQTGRWLLFDVGSDYHAIGNGEERLTAGR